MTIAVATLVLATPAANIGGGLVLLFGYPLAGLLIIAAALDKGRSGGSA